MKWGEGISFGSKGEGNAKINLKDGRQRFTRQRLLKKNMLVQFNFDEV